jgi:hypothetical protein
MAVLKRIKFGSQTYPIAMTQVQAATTGSTTALTVTGAQTGLDVDANPVYSIALAIDGKTIKTGAQGLETGLSLAYVAGVQGGAAAHIALKDGDDTELSTVAVSDLVGSGIVSSTSYDETTGILTINWVSGSPTQIDLGKLLDIDDVIVKSGSGDFLEVSLTGAQGDAGQMQIGVKLADVTYTATSGTQAASLTADTTNGKILDASDAIPAIQGYVADVLANASTNLAVTAEGDDYVSASVDAATDNKHVIVDSNVVALTATAGSAATYDANGQQTAAATPGTLSGTQNSLADSADIAAKVKTYVDGAIAIEGARSDAKNKADILAGIQALDFADGAQSGKFVTAVSETDGVISVSRDYLTDAVLAGYALGAQTGAIAATDTLEVALNKLENGVQAAAEAATEGAQTALENAVNALEDEIAGVQDDLADGVLALEDKIDGVQTGAQAALVAGIQALDSDDTAETGKVVVAVDTVDGKAESEKVNLAGVQLGGFTQDATAKGAIAATDTLGAALNKLQNKADAVQYSVSGTTLEFFGINPHA